MLNAHVRLWPQGLVPGLHVSWDDFVDEVNRRCTHGEQLDLTVARANDISTSPDLGGIMFVQGSMLTRALVIRIKGVESSFGAPIDVSADLPIRFADGSFFLTSDERSFRIGPPQ